MNKKINLLENKDEFFDLISKEVDAESGLQFLLLTCENTKQKMVEINGFMKDSEFDFTSFNKNYSLEDVKKISLMYNLGVQIALSLLSADGSAYLSLKRTFKLMGSISNFSKFSVIELPRIGNWNRENNFIEAKFIHVFNEFLMKNTFEECEFFYRSLLLQDYKTGREASFESLM